jgi:hypothetical protein
MYQKKRERNVARVLVLFCSVFKIIYLMVVSSYVYFAFEILFYGGDLGGYGKNGFF